MVRSNSYIKKKNLPAGLRAVIADRKTICYQTSDLTSSRKFGSSFLVVTDKTLLTVCDGAILEEYRLDEIGNLKNEELVGGGRLSAVLKDGTRHLIYYSNHKVLHFTDTARFIMDYIAGNASAPPEEQFDSFCQKCNSPLPDPQGNCPRCVPKLKVFSRILALSYPYKGRLISLMIVTALGVAFQVMPPYITKKIVDEVIEGGNTSRLYLYTGMMIVSGVLYFFMRILNIYLTSGISARIVSDLRARLHTVLQYLKLNFFTKREPGEIVGRVMHDTGELLQFLVEGVPYLLINTISFFVVAAILISINWMLALFIFIPVPLLVIGSGWFWKKLHPLFLRQGSVIGHMHSVLNESFYGLKVIKAFSQEKRRIAMFNSVNDRLASTEKKTFRIFGTFNEFMYAVMALGVSLVWFFAVHMIVGEEHRMTLGDLLAFVGYIWLFYGPLQYFSVILNWMTHAFSGAERIFEIIDSNSESHDQPDAVELPRINGHIEFRDVHFSYETGKEVIKGISLDIKPGEVIGLVGKSGAGKSTIINLLSRFFEPDSGQVLLDGVPVEKIKLEQLRKSMGVVLQEPFLFNATIADNIAYGLQNTSFNEIVNAARAAHAHEFIMRKPDGYDTVIGNGSGSLSGGEKQRLAIARAILHNPPVLVLDEATSAVDATTEMHIQKAISDLVKGRTTIAIAHRLSTLRNADRLVVVDNGVIVEMGTHDQLMKKGGAYATMANSYSKINTLQSVVWGG